MWGCQPSYNDSLETKNCRVVKPENWVSKLNFHTDLGLYVGSSHPKIMSKLTKPPFKFGIWKEKKTGVTCEVITPQRPYQVWSRPLAMLLLKLRTVGLLNLKIEWANSISIQNWDYVWGHQIQRQQNKKKLNHFSAKKSTYKVLLLRSSALISKTTLSLEEDHWFVVSSFIIAQ